MKKINLKYQAAIFVKAEDISPVPDTLTYFISELSDKQLIPGTFQEIGPSGPLNRFFLKDSEGIWNLEFSSNRIDIIKTNVNIGVTNMGDVSDFQSDLNKFIDIIFEKFPRKANRIAFIVTHILYEIDQSEFSTIFTKNLNPVTIYRDNEPLDWGTRMASRISKEFNERTEQHNVITEINRLKGNLNINSTVKNIDRLQIKLDINTFQGNNDFRFNVEDLKAYFTEALSWEDDLRNQLYTLWKL